MSVFEESKAYRPFKYPLLVEMAKTQSVDMHWTDQQVELQDDLRQYNSENGLKTENVSHRINKEILDKILCLFTELDKVVAGSYVSLLPHVNNNEVRNWFLTCASREVIHQRAYALAAETFGFKDSDWIEFKEYVEMQDKIDIMYCDGEINSKLDFAKTLTKLLLSEGIGLFAAFATLLNFKRYGLLVGTNDINQWSLLDENEHVQGNIYVLEQVVKELSEEEKEDLKEYTISLIRGFVVAEHKFIDLVFTIGNPEGLTKEELKEYIEYLGELRYYQLGYSDVYGIRKNPLKWLEWMLSAGTHDNFFEKRVTDYSHEGLIGDIDYTKYSSLKE